MDMRVCEEREGKGRKLTRGSREMDGHQCKKRKNRITKAADQRAGDELRGRLKPAKKPRLSEETETERW